MTVTLKEQDGPAFVVQLTVVVPLGKNEPDAGAHVTVPHALDVGAKLTTAPHSPRSFPWVISDGHVITHSDLHLPALSAATIERISSTDKARLNISTSSIRPVKVLLPV